MQFPEGVQNKVETSAKTILAILLGVGLGTFLIAMIYEMLILPPYKTTCVTALSCNTSQDPSVAVTVTTVTLKPGDPVNNTEETVDTSLTPTLPLSPEELFTQQEKELRALPPCKPVRTNVKLKEEQKYWDGMLDKKLLRQEVALDRCDYSCGQCLGGKRCLPTKTTKIPVAIPYVDDNGKFEYAKKEVEQHIECSCKIVHKFNRLI